MVKMSVITDEISRDFITASEVLNDLNIRDIELRSLRTGRVPYITQEEERELEKYIRRNHFHIHAMSPAVAKLNIATQDLREKTIKHLHDSIDFAKRFCIENIIIFSFRKHDKNDRNEMMPDIGWDILEEMMEIGEKNNINILIENHSSCYVSTIDTIFDLVNHARFKNKVKITWDPNNSYQVDKQSYVKGLEGIVNSIKNIHVKDTVYSNGGEEIRVPLGDGKVGWVQFLMI